MSGVITGEMRTKIAKMLAKSQLATKASIHDESSDVHGITVNAFLNNYEDFRDLVLEIERTYNTTGRTVSDPCPVCGKPYELVSE